jgi:hypothetical protein
VGAGIAGVAVAAAKRHGNTAVSDHRQDEQELLEIGTVGLGVAVGYRRRRASADLAPPSPTVGAAEADRGAVIMKLVELQGEGLSDRKDHIGDERRAIGIKQAVEGTPQAIIAQVLHLLGRDAEHTGGEAIYPLLLAVDRLSFDDDRAQQHAERAGVRDNTALIGGDVSSQRIVQSHTCNEMIDDGEGAEALDQQGGVNHFP